jgi:exodeoxyribonuclease VII small subunit
MAAKTKTADPATFEQSLKKLEESVHKLEDGSLGLDEALKTFEQGIQYSRQCHARLVEAEKKVEILLKNEKEELTQVAFDLDEGE